MNSPHPRSKAFTLVELLVSMAILALFLVMMSAMVNSTATLTGSSNKQIDTDNQARLIFDRMALDFAAAIKRPDVDYFFRNNPGNDLLAFYSEAPGYYPSSVTGETPKSGISLVGYRVNEFNQLERLGRSLVWNGVTSSTVGASGVTGTDQTAMVYLPKTLEGTWPGIVDGSDANYQVIADLVYRLETHFLLKPYTDSSGTEHPSVLSLTPWDTRQGHSSVNGLADVTAVVVSLALLDNTSRKLVEPAKYADMISALPDAAAGTSLLQTWSANLTASGIPNKAAGQIRLYQRAFYLDNK